MAKRILIVDDEPDILTVITFRLKQLGHEIVVAEDGQKAIEEVKKTRPDLILLDLLLPIMDGYEVCKAIKSDEELKTIPVLLVTASVTEDMELKTKKLNADGYIIKPFDSEKLLEKVKSILG